MLTGPGYVATVHYTHHHHQILHLRPKTLTFSGFGKLSIRGLGPTDFATALELAVVGTFLNSVGSIYDKPV